MLAECPGWVHAGELRVRDHARVRPNTVWMEAKFAEHNCAVGIARALPPLIGHTSPLLTTQAICRSWVMSISRISWLIEIHVARSGPTNRDLGSQKPNAADTLDMDAPVQMHTHVYMSEAPMGDAHCSPLHCHCPDLRVGRQTGAQDLQARNGRHGGWHELYRRRREKKTRSVPPLPLSGIKIITGSLLCRA